MSQQQAIGALATARGRITVVAAGSRPGLRQGLAEANLIIADLESELRQEDARSALVADAAEAQERFGDDELEAAAERKPAGRAGRQCSRWTNGTKCRRTATTRDDKGYVACDEHGMTTDAPASPEEAQR